jgi:dynein assembly factor with WDR repeat domains 1
MSNVKLKKFLLRYYPPGIILQYERDGVMKQKPIDLLDLTPDVDIEVCWGAVGFEALAARESQRDALAIYNGAFQHVSHAFAAAQVLCSQIIRQEPLISENRYACTTNA